MNELKRQFTSIKVPSDQIIDLEELNELKNNQNLLIDRAYDFIKDSDYEHALELFCIGLQSDNSDPDLLNGLGITLCELNRMEEAKAILKRAVRLNSDDAITIANLAGVCWELEEYEEAIHHYAESLKQDPDLEDVYINLINLYFECDSVFMAFITCTQLLDRFPDHEEAQELLDDIILNLGIMLL